ncbi:MAG: DUF6531 domain-containing protein [Acidobacteriia bacterium]|nr:DUF6531 domain-containing protein [Terriglobia bacterium]
MRINKMNGLRLTSLTMALVMLAPAQQPLPTAPPSPVIIAQRTQPRTPLAQAPAGVALQVATPLPGQSTTLLPDGSSLMLGGTLVSNAVANARVGNGVLSSSLLHARAWHTSTVLPDGNVFIFGGLDGQALVPESEIFSPATRTFSPLTSTSLAPRAFHTATLLTDGQVLIAGGTGTTGQPFGALDLWDPKTKTAQRVPMQLAQPRLRHTATLQPDGTVRIEGGVRADGAIATQIEIFDPNALTVTPIEAPPPSPADLSLAASIPADGGKSVSLDSLIALRFSRALAAKSVNAATLTIRDQNGPVAAVGVSAEAGMLAFVNVAGGLQNDTHYTVSVNGASDKSGFPLPPSEFSFSTKSTPATDSTKSNTPANQEDPPVPPLQAGPNVTALSGFVRTVSGKYLPQVTLELNCGEETRRRLRAVSDGTGRFLIANTPSGHCKLEIDGTTVKRGSEVYGIFTPGVDITKNTTNVLPYTIWMTPLDVAHSVTIPSPTTSEFVLTNPTIQDLELHLPSGAVVKDYDGNVINQLSITRIPIARPPFPLPGGVAVNFYFTIQPGGAYVEVNGVPAGAQLYYPNQNRAPAGYKMNFWNYDPEGKGWYVYGSGAIDANRRYAIPDPGTRVYSFTGAMVAGPDKGPPGPGPEPDGPTAGDPVDLATGLFTYHRTDFYIPDILPLALVRVYRQRDPLSHAFGIGMTHNLDIFLVGDTNPYTYIDLIEGDGSRVHFKRTSPGTSFSDAVYQTTSDPGFLGAQISWNGNGWTLTHKNGVTWTFPDGYGVTLPARAAVLSMKDRYGNTITMTRDATTGRLLKVTSPNARFITFAYDAANRVTQATDNAGRSVSYQYDAAGRLIDVTDPNGGHFHYTYDANNQMLTLQDARGIVFITNQYDTSGRVVQQTLANSGTHQFSYTQDGNGNITQTDVTDPRGKVRRTTFNTNGYFSGGKMTGQTFALGTSEHQTFSYQRDSQTNLLQSVTDPLSRVTAFTYDGKGNVLTVTANSGTANAVTSTYTYDSTFSQLTSSTDPLNHTSTLAVDSAGKTTSITDPLSHQITFTYNTAGEVLTTTSTAGTTTLGYLSGNLVSVTDPLGNTLSATFDSLGRVLRSTDAAGGTRTSTRDPYNQLLQTIDPGGASTTFSYDANGNLLTLTDARGNATTYTYNSMDLVATRTDPLSHGDSRTYDLNGNLSTFTDRKSQATTYTYDALNRLTQVLFADASTIAYTYDAGNRVTQIVDSISGTITRTYDTFDRLTNETAPQGSVSYTYDAAGRRTSLTVAGQSAVNYSYDNANRLTQITQGSSTVGFGYDSANRRTSLTLPNGVVATYGYDAASHVTSISYALSGTSLGNLLYSFDAAGRVTSVGGSLARTSLPAVLSSATYNANNQLTQWGTANLTYDLNGSLTSDGTTTHTWNARNRLSAFGSTGFAYDAFGRRIQNASGKALLYDGPNQVQELSGSSVTANMLTGLSVDEVFTRTDSAGSRNVLQDGLGSTVALLDSSGTVQTQYTYEPFGNTTSTGATSANSSQFTGRENDGTGLYYYRARYYNPTLGRFISEDPIGFAGGVNVYAYALNSPVGLSDPSGLYTFQFGGTVNFNWGIIAGTGSFGYVIDGTGTIGVYLTLGGGLGFGADVTGGVSTALSNGQSITDLQKWFANQSVGGAYGPGASVDTFQGTTADGRRIEGVGATVGGGVGGGGSSTMTYTWIWPFPGGTDPSTGPAGPAGPTACPVDFCLPPLVYPDPDYPDPPGPGGPRGPGSPRGPGPMGPGRK